MARTQEITLPWKPTVDGAVAELGAVFRVEVVGGDWQCAVKSGRCRTIIAKGLKSEGSAKRRAEAHAATMPEVHEAATEATADAKPRARRREAPKRSQRPKAKSRETAAAPASGRAPAAAPEGSQPPSSDDAAISFQQTEDGCLCGKTQGVCWVANGQEVALARPLPDSVVNLIRAAVAQHYAAQRAAKTRQPRPAAPRPAKKSAKTVPQKESPPKAPAKKAARKTAKTAPRKESPPKEPANKSKATGRSAPAKKPEPARKLGPAPAKGRKAGRGRASKPKTRKPARDEAKEDAPVTAKTGKAKAAPRTTSEPSKAAPEATGPIAWSDVEGKPRGVAAHGTFIIEPEGQAFGLYFADASGQSRHLRSGAEAELRRAAEEYAARGEPTSLRDAPSREQDEALMRIFASGAVAGT